MTEPIKPKQSAPYMYKGIFKSPEFSGWKCYMFGCYPTGDGIVYTPSKGAVPNRFVRWMMKVCFDCLWVKEN